MLNFNFQNKTELIFGKNTETLVGREARKYGRNVLLHYGSGTIKKSGLYDKIINSLINEGMEVFELSGVVPNPRLSLVRVGIGICKEKNIDIIIAVGGGSVIDSAKAISAGVKYSGDVWDFFSKPDCFPSSVLPLGVVLTIPAAGSESSSGIIITNENGWYKRSFSNNLCRPLFAIMNPQLTYSLPPYQTAAGAVDMMVHVFERYFTNVKNIDLTDRLCEAILKTIIANTPKVLENPINYDARAELMLASTLAHNGLLDTGRQSDWASHRIEHELSALYELTHGVGLAIISPAWMKYVYKNDIERFAQFAVRVWDIDYDFNSPLNTALLGIKKTEDFFKSLGLPTSLEDAHVPTNKFLLMAEKCTEKGPVGNFVKLNKEAVIQIYELAK